MKRNQLYSVACIENNAAEDTWAVRAYKSHSERTAAAVVTGLLFYLRNNYFIHYDYNLRTQGE